MLILNGTRRCRPRCSSVRRANALYHPTVALHPFGKAGRKLKSLGKDCWMAEKPVKPAGDGSTIWTGLTAFYRIKQNPVLAGTFFRDPFWMASGRCLNSAARYPSNGPTLPKRSERRQSHSPSRRFGPVKYRWCGIVTIDCFARDDDKLCRRQLLTTPHVEESARKSMISAGECRNGAWLFGVSTWLPRTI